jgi:hypothetical protein
LVVHPLIRGTLAANNRRGGPTWTRLTASAVGGNNTVVRLVGVSTGRVLRGIKDKRRHLQEGLP